MERFRSDHSGPGFSGEAGLWRDGDWYEVYVPQTGQPTFVNSRWCYDTADEHFDPVTGAEKDHDFFLESLEGDSVPRFNCDYDSDHDGTSFKLRNWVVSDLRSFQESLLASESGAEDVSFDPEWLWHLDLFDRLSPVTDLLARTNPNVPKTDIPSFLFESLRDAPSLIYNSGQTLLGRLGSSNLNWQFGWKPLIADLGNLLSFAESTAKQLRRLQRAVKKGRYRAKASLEYHEDTVTSSFEMKINDNHGPFQLAFPSFEDPLVEVTKHTTISRWGVVSYSLDDEWVRMWKRLDFDEKKFLAMRSAFGLHAQNPAALWEIIPWSWFIDWFIPMQELLSTYNNFVPVKVQNLCVMTNQVTDFSFGATNFDWLNLDAPTRFRRVTKGRQVLSPEGELPILHKVGVQLLGPRQLGILGSIAAGRRRFNSGTVFKSLPR